MAGFDLALRRERGGDVAILTHFFQTMSPKQWAAVRKSRPQVPSRIPANSYPANRLLTKKTNRGRSRRGSQMFPARRFAAFLPVAGAFFAFLFPLSNAQAQDLPCEASAEVAVLPSPAAPWTGAPLRVLVATEKPLQGELSLVAPDGRIAAKSHMQRGGPPYVWFAEVASPAAGGWRATFDTSSFTCGTITKDIDVSARKPSAANTAEGSVWRLHNSWDRSTENCTRRGSPSFLTRRSKRSSHGRRGMRCCAIHRAMCCSIILERAKTASPYR